MVALRLHSLAAVIVCSVYWTTPEALAVPLPPPIDFKTGVYTRPIRSASSSNAFVELISVTRAPVPGESANRFIIRYRKNFSGAVSCHVKDDDGPKKIDPREGVNGEWSVSFASPIGYRGLTFTMWDNVLDHMLVLKLRSHGNQPMSYSDFDDLPTLALSPEGQILYTPGQNVSGSMLIQPATAWGRTVRSADLRFTGVNLQTRKFHLRMEHEEFLSDIGWSLGFLAIRIRGNIRTSQQHLSGFLEAIAFLRAGGHMSLVHEMQIKRHGRVKPSNQEGLVPSGYLEFLDDPEQTSQNGNELIRCRVGNVCWASCLVAADRISSVQLEVFKFHPNGRRTIVQNTRIFPYLTFSKYIYWNIAAHENSGDRNGITTFQCKATDAINNTTATRLLDIQAIIISRVDTGMSGVTIQNVLSQPNRKNVTLSCTVRSRPHPRVTFSGKIARNISFSNSPPDRVTPLGDFKVKSTKSFIVDVEDFNWLVREISAGRETGPYCYFISILRAYPYQYNFRLSEIRRTTAGSSHVGAP